MTTCLANVTEKDSRPVFLERRYLTVPQVAKVLQVSTDWVYKNYKQLGGVKIGGIIRFIDNEIVERIEGLNYAKTTN